MNYQKLVIEDLRNYKSQKESLKNIRIRIAALDDQLMAVKSSTTDSIPVQGGASRNEERLLDKIVKRDRLKLTYRATRSIVRLVEKGLTGLDERERIVLERFFIDRPNDHVELLMEELNVEKTQVYRIKDDALYKLTMRLYGLQDY